MRGARENGRIGACIAAALLLALGACDDPASPDPTGDWTLARLNGQPLPYRPTPALVRLFDGDPACLYEVVSGSLRLEPDGRFAATFATRRRCGDRLDERSHEAEGVYVRQGDELRFRVPDEELTVTGELEARTLRVSGLLGLATGTFRRANG